MKAFLISIVVIYILGVLFFRWVFSAYKRKKDLGKREVQVLRTIIWIWPGVVIWLLMDKYMDKPMNSSERV